MVAFPETEPMTIKRIEVALRNKDLYLLQEATNKLHERYHTGFEFTMFDELYQIKSYIENNDIPDEIKDVLCPTIDGILSSAGKNVTEYKVDEEKERQREELKKNYDYNFGDPASDSTSRVEDIEMQSEENTTEENVEAQNQENIQDSDLTDKAEDNYEENQYQQAQTQEEYRQEYNEGGQQSFDFSNLNQEQNQHQEQVSYEYSEHHQQQPEENQYDQSQENFVETSQNYEQEYSEQPNEQQENIEEKAQNDEQEYQEPNSINDNQEEAAYDEVKEEDNKSKDKVAIFYYASSGKDESHAVKDYRQKLNFINSNLYARQPVNILEKISEIMDLVDVKDGICDFLLGLSKTKSKKTFITTSINQNITNYLATNGVKFQIPMVQNTYCENPSLDIIPMFGATNLFTCKKCGSMFLNTGSYLKVLSLNISFKK